MTCADCDYWDEETLECTNPDSEFYGHEMVGHEQACQK
jgi:hypothetical protein